MYKNIKIGLILTIFPYLLIASEYPLNNSLDRSDHRKRRFEMPQQPTCPGAPFVLPPMLPYMMNPMMSHPMFPFLLMSQYQLNFPQPMPPILTQQSTHSTQTQAQPKRVKTADDYTARKLYRLNKDLDKLDRTSDPSTLLGLHGETFAKIKSKMGALYKGRTTPLININHIDKDHINSTEICFSDKETKVRLHNTRPQTYFPADVTKTEVFNLLLGYLRNNSNELTECYKNELNGSSLLFWKTRNIYLEVIFCTGIPHIIRTAYPIFRLISLKKSDSDFVKVKDLQPVSEEYDDSELYLEKEVLLEDIKDLIRAATNLSPTVRYFDGTNVIIDINNIFKYNLCIRHYVELPIKELRDEVLELKIKDHWLKKVAQHNLISKH